MGIRKASVIAALCATLAGAAGGCGVSKATHQAVAEELQTCEGERDQYAAKRSELARRVEELETRLEAERSATQEELESLRKVFGSADIDRPRAGLGSIKSMIGHAMPAGFAPWG